MGLQADWFDAEKTIILYEFVGEWTWEDLNVLVEQANEMTRSVEHRVDTIIDLRRNGSFPFGALMRFRSLTASAPENWGMAVFVSTNEFMTNLLGVVTKIFPKIGERYAIAETIEEAQAVILRKSNREPA